MAGTCINRTSEAILVYGSNSPLTPQDKENALYRLPVNRKTPNGWDCDGIFIPKNRVAVQLIGADTAGPVAVKYVGGTILGVDIDITFEITQSVNKYILPANQGVFSPAEVCCPSNYPTCVCWEIPNISNDQLGAYPEVPNPVPA